jgi:hypothetical protein
VGDAQRGRNGKAEDVNAYREGLRMRQDAWLRMGECMRGMHEAVFA